MQQTIRVTEEVDLLHAAAAAAAAAGGGSGYMQ
jgi:hypothetical protein